MFYNTFKHINYKTIFIATERRFLTGNSPIVDKGILLLSVKISIHSPRHPSTYLHIIIHNKTIYLKFNIHTICHHIHISLETNKITHTNT